MTNPNPPKPLANGVWIINEQGEEECLYVPTPKQEEFHRCTQPNVLFWGGRGSGKSMALRWEAHARALAHPGFTYIILRRTYPELQRSHLVHVPTEMRKLGGSFHHTTKTAVYPNGSRGFFSHCQNEEDVLNLLSAEFAWAGFDELSTFEWEMFTKLSASVRVPIGTGLTAMVRAATNPLGPSAQEILTYFVNKDVDLDNDPDYNPNDWHSIHANLEDNPHLDEKQYLKRFSGLPAHVRKAWVDGEFILENALFDFRPTIRVVDPDTEEAKTLPYHVVDDLDLAKVLKSCTIYRAIDAGWFPDPTLVLWIAHLGNRHIVINEKIWYKTIAADVARDIKAEDARLAEMVDSKFQLKVAMTYCDPSMDINTTADIKTVKEIFEANGIPMECSINKREMFAGSVHTALAEEAGAHLPRLQFYKGRMFGCPYLIKTIPMQRYDPKHTMKMADHKDDHAVVALAYYLMSHSSDNRQDISFGDKPKKWMTPKAPDSWVLGRESVRTPR